MRTFRGVKPTVKSYDCDLSNIKIGSSIVNVVKECWCPVCGFNLLQLNCDVRKITKHCPVCGVLLDMEG